MTVDTWAPDDWPPERWREVGERWGKEIPPEPERDLDMLHLEFIAWLVATGRLEGDTPPRAPLPTVYLGCWE